MSDHVVPASATAQPKEFTATLTTSPESAAKPTAAPEPIEMAAAGDAAVTATVTSSFTGYDESPVEPAQVSLATAAENNRKFLEQVVVWPKTKETPGWINLHTHLKNPDPNKNGGRPFVVGWPFKTAPDLIARAQWVHHTDTFFDAWYCTSQQSECTTTKAGKPKAVRLHKNATWLKAIWVDIDVGNKLDPVTGQPETKHYDTAAEAWAAISAFRKKVGLPAPSAVVNSGGGLHVYWISDQPLAPADWRPYAEGLKALLLAESVKCDAGLTTDDVRILRVPGTFNHKYDPPRPVVLRHLGEMYDFGTTLSFLKQQTLAPKSASTASAELIDPGFDLSGPDPAFAALSPLEKLSAAVQLTSTLLDPRPIFAKNGCGFLRAALRNGGKDYDNPLWNLSVLCAAFMENGNAIAHDISRGHSTYSQVDTQALYDRKVADRADRNLGYPSCAAIAGSGCKSCATCPLFAKGKSPLNIRPVVTATVNPVALGPALWSSTAMTVIFANIPHRRTLYGFDLVRGELTVVGGPGGAGKSSLAIGIGGTIAAGRELLGEKIYGTDLRVLLVNAEDSTNEIRRRVIAFSLAHGLVEQDLGRLCIAGADHPNVQAMSFLRVNAAGSSDLDTSGLVMLEAALEALRPDLVVLDPLIALCAGGNTNDNSSMALVMRALKWLATKFDCAILIVHHTRKGGDAGSAEAISGAAAIVNLARRAIMPVGISIEEAAKLGILASERHQYVRLIDAKSNLAPRASDAPLYRLHSVDLRNPEPPTYPFGDNVQAIVRVQLPLRPAGSGPTDEDKIRTVIVDLVQRGKVIDGKSYPYSPSAAGADNVRAILHDAISTAQTATAPRRWAAGDLEAVVKAIIKQLLKDGTLVALDMKDIMPEPGRFRRARGLQVNHAHLAQGGSDATDTAVAA
jgi:hypothetical protein